MATSDSPRPSPLERLEAVQEISRIFAARLRCMDTRDWDSYGSFHTEDVVSDSWAGRPGVVGRTDLTEAIRNTLDGAVRVTSVHHGHTPEIEVLSATTARGTWAMEDHLWWTNGDHEEHLHGYGHYHEEYRKVDDRWLISYRTLIRLREDSTPDFYSYRKVR